MIRYCKIVDYTSGILYYSHEYYNFTKSVIEQCVGNIKKHNFKHFNIYILIYKLVSRKYFHYSIQQNNLIFYYRLAQNKRGYLLIGLNVNRAGIPIKIKFYMYSSKKKKFTAAGVDIARMKMYRCDSHIMYKKKNICILYRDNNNIYICFEGKLLHLAENVNKILLVVDIIQRRMTNKRKNCERGK